MLVLHKRERNLGCVLGVDFSSVAALHDGPRSPGRSPVRRFGDLVVGKILLSGEKIGEGRPGLDQV